MTPYFQRALLLFEQSRYDLAEQELRQALTANADDPMAHALLAMCLSEREQHAEATREAEQAIRIAPDLSFGHYVRAHVMRDRERIDEAEASVKEALRLDPGDANYHALHSQILLDRRNWPGALEAAERGLALEPEHVTCNNLRAIALVRLGRKEEAGATIGAALAREPENAVTHANQGWALLDEGEPQRAMEHFREALRLEPGNEWARLGIVEALKAKHTIYSWMLRYFLWMGKLSGGAQWAIVLGGYFGYRFLRELAAKEPDWAPYIWPVLIAYLVFAVMSWVADPLFNLVLRMNRFGRLVLSREQTVASNWIGLCILAALTALGTWVATQRSEAGWSALMFGVLIPPLSGTFQCRPGWPRWVMALCTVLLLAAGTTALWFMFHPERTRREFNFGIDLFTKFLLAAFLSQFLSNALLFARPKK